MTDIEKLREIRLELWGVWRRMPMCDAKSLLASVIDDVLVVKWALEGEYGGLR